VLRFRIEPTIRSGIVTSVFIFKLNCKNIKATIIKAITMTNNVAIVVNIALKNLIQTNSF